jgi:hypothetical protein
MIKLFITGFLQVFFVTVNTYFISKSNLLGVAICGFTISFLWTANVKRAAFGTMTDRITYSFGAMTGGLLGLFLAKIII